MKPSWEWTTESDLLSLVSNQVHESITLDYKESDSLQRADGRKKEISKDVSAFANSAGGTIVYGMKEDKRYPTGLDVGSDPTVITKEWLEQVINGTIRRRIDGVKINQVELTTSSPGRVAYVVFIPPSNMTPCP